MIDRLQRSKGSVSFNNMRGAKDPHVDFVAHAASLGARAERVATLEELPAALARARSADRTSVLVLATDPDAWTGGDAWWDVGVPEVSERGSVRDAKEAHEAERKHQRMGV